jgi:hypothetical protein
MAAAAAAVAHPEEQQLTRVLSPVRLTGVLAAPELQPLRVAAAAVGHVTLAMRGGRALYVFDGPLPAGRTSAGAR